MILPWSARIYGPDYRQPGIIHLYGPDYGQPEVMNGSDYG